MNVNYSLKVLATILGILAVGGSLLASVLVLPERVTFNREELKALKERVEHEVEASSNMRESFAKFEGNTTAKLEQIEKGIEEIKLSLQKLDK